MVPLDGGLEPFPLPLPHVLHKCPYSPVTPAGWCNFEYYVHLATCLTYTFISQEKLIAKDVVAWRLGCFLHMLNLFLMLLIPILVINVKSDYIGVLGATVVTLTYSILFLKLWSYVQVEKES